MASAASNIERDDGVSRSGVYFRIAADASPSAVVFSVGFKPRYVRVVNTTDSSVDELFDGASAKINTAGAGAAASALTWDQTANTVSVTMAANKAAAVCIE